MYEDTIGVNLNASISISKPITNFWKPLLLLLWHHSLWDRDHPYPLA